MATSTIKHLREALGLGLGTISRIWENEAKDWVTSVHVADVDADGEVEVVACSRDGRVHLIGPNGIKRWERIIGTKSKVGTVAAENASMKDVFARIVTGTRSGKIYTLNKDGNTVTKEGKIYPFDESGRDIRPKEEPLPCWYDARSVIEQVTIVHGRQPLIVFGSDDHKAYGLDYYTGEKLWEFETHGRVKTVRSYINSHEETRILIGSEDGYLYILNAEGMELNAYPVKYPVHTIAAIDSRLDGGVDIFVATNNKYLIALTWYEAGDEEQSISKFVRKWSRVFNQRVISLAIADLDSDGAMEIIACSEDTYIYILDNKGSIIWRHNHKFRILSVFPYDIDKDGLPELVIGNEHNRIRAMRVRLHKGLEQRIRKHYRALEVTNPEVLSELTTDERSLLTTIIATDKPAYITFQEIQPLFESNEHDRLLSKLLQLQQQKVEPCWQKSNIGPIRSVLLRHTPDESKCEIIVGTSNDTIYALNDRGRHTWSASFNEHISDLRTRTIDHGKREEVVLCTSGSHHYVLSKSKQIRKYGSTADASSPVDSCEMMDTVQSVSNIGVRPADFLLKDEEKFPISMPSERRKSVIARSPSGDRTQEIVAISNKKSVSVFAKNQMLRWKYATYDPVRSICIKDINGDGKFEVVIGANDRNIHVIDNAGQRLWRYFLPRNVLSVDVATMDDGQVAIFAGCADGFLYVFNKEGMLLWTYQAQDRIYAVRVEDIDADGNIEIVVGLEGELELLRIINQQQINLLITRTWQVFSQEHGYQQAIDKLLNSDDTFLQAFALNKLLEQSKEICQDFDLLETFVKSEDLKIRKPLVQAIMTLYPSNPERAKDMLSTLWSDSDRDMRIAFIEQLPLLMEYNWEPGFQYLKRTFEAKTSDRFVKRMVIRTLHQLIDVSIERPREWQQKIFELLLLAAQEEDSEWVRQEAARTTAHFLNQYHGNLVVYVHLFIVKEVRVSVLEDIAYATTVPVVRYFLNAVILMLKGLDASNVSERLQNVVKALEGVSTFAYGKALWLIYGEMYRLFSIETIEQIANYQCELQASQFDAENEFALNILEIFNHLSRINRPLKMYLRREDVHDRMTSLIDTVDALDKAFSYLDQKYALRLMGEPISSLPDKQIFSLLLTKWREKASSLLTELRGKPELQTELQTKIVPYDEQVSIWLRVENVGRSLASDVRVTLLHNHSKSFEIVEGNSSEIDLLLPRDDTTLEFTLKPAATVLDLQFEITYDDTENNTKIEQFEECLHLREAHQEFHKISNPYSSGTPIHKRSMFYGRERDIASLQDYLTRDTKNVVVLYGQRRSGKTSLLIQLRNSPVINKAVFVLIDLQNMSYEMESIEKLLHRFAYFIVKALKAHKIELCLPALTDFAGNPTYTFDVFLDQVEEQLAGRKLNLLIDEFELLEEHVMNGELRPQIFEYLRDIVQHRPTINFLFSGTHKITELTKWYRSVFFHIARHHRISRLNFQGAEDLIVKPVEDFLEYEPHSLTKIHALTADQPYLIHLMCNAIVEYCNDRQKTFVTINDVNAVLDQVLATGGHHFDWLWERIKPEVRLTLTVLAEGGKEEGRWLSFAEIEGLYRHYHLTYKREYVLDALKTLHDADIIESLDNNTVKKTQDNKRYRIAIGLIRYWLLQEHSLVTVMNELCD